MFVITGVVVRGTQNSYPEKSKSVPHHNGGRALSSHCSVNSFIMVATQTLLFYFSQKFLSKPRFKKFSQTTSIKLFTDQSEVSALPAGCLFKIIHARNAHPVFFSQIYILTYCQIKDIGSDIIQHHLLESSQTFRTHWIGQLSHRMWTVVEPRKRPGTFKCYLH